MWSVCLLVLSLVAHTANPTSISKVEECLDVTHQTCDEFLEEGKRAAGASDYSLNETAAVCSVLVKKEATWQDANKTCAEEGGMLVWVMHKVQTFYGAMGGVDFWTGLYQLDYTPVGRILDAIHTYWMYTCPVVGKRGPAWNDTNPPAIPWKTGEPSKVDPAAAIMTNGGKLADAVPADPKSYVCQAGGSSSTVVIGVLAVRLLLAVLVIGIVLYVRRNKNRGKEKTGLDTPDMPLIFGQTGTDQPHHPQHQYKRR